MAHAHSWHTIASYPWARGLIYKERCDRCGRVKKIRTEWPEVPSGRSSADGGSLGGVGGFLIGIGFATLVFAIATLRGCG